MLKIDTMNQSKFAIEGAVLGSYSYPLKPKKKEDKKEENGGDANKVMTFAPLTGEIDDGWKDGELCALFETEARTLANMPGLIEISVFFVFLDS